MPFTIRWLGQGGYLLTLGKQTLAIDPYLSNSVERAEGFARLVPVALAPESLRADAVVATHDHLDHLDPDTLTRVDAAQTRFLGPESCVARFCALGIPAARCERLARGDSLPLGEARVSGVFARHTPDSIGVVVAYAGVKLYFCGDTLFDERLMDIGVLGIDIAFLCINGKMGNMNADEAARVACGLPARVALPAHYGMFAANTEDPARFARALEGSGVAVRVPRFDETLSVYELLALAG